VGHDEMLTNIIIWRLAVYRLRIIGQAFHTKYFNPKLGDHNMWSSPETKGAKYSNGQKIRDSHPGRRAVPEKKLLEL
jgi:hypothetical protein